IVLGFLFSRLSVKPLRYLAGANTRNPTGSLLARDIWIADWRRRAGHVAVCRRWHAARYEHAQKEGKSWAGDAAHSRSPPSADRTYACAGIGIGPEGPACQGDDVGGRSTDGSFRARKPRAGTRGRARVGRG